MNALIIGGSGGLSSVVAALAMKEYRVWTVTRGVRELPEAVENKTYYEVIAGCLGVRLNIEEVPLSGYLEKHPEYSGHLCHRVYDLSKLKAAGVKMPSVDLKTGIARCLSSMGYK